MLWKATDVCELFDTLERPNRRLCGSESKRGVSTGFVGPRARHGWPALPRRRIEEYVTFESNDLGCYGALIIVIGALFAVLDLFCDGLWLELRVVNVSAWVMTVGMLLNCIMMTVTQGPIVTSPQRPLFVVAFSNVSCFHSLDDDLVPVISRVHQRLAKSPLAFPEHSRVSSPETVSSTLSPKIQRNAKFGGGR